MNPSTFEACDAYGMRDDNTENDSAPGETWRTRWGVVPATWASAVHMGIVPNKPFEQSTQDECQAVRHALFWNALHCGQLPRGINYLVYSAGLLSGPGYIARTVQRIVGATQDGVIGKETLIAINRHGDKQLMDAIWAANAQHFKDVNKPQFLHGWNIRNDQDIAEAYMMAGVPASAPQTPAAIPVAPDPADNSADALMAAEQTQLDQGNQS